MKHVAVGISMRPFTMKGTLTLPDHAGGVVLFALGSAGTHASRHDRHMARALEQAELGTLLLDLLSPEEQKLRDDTDLPGSDIHLLAGRLLVATDWLREQPDARELGVGYFGVGAGTAAALLAAAERSSTVRALVSEDGLPQLAGPALSSVHAPTRLIVDERPSRALFWNRIVLPDLPSTAKDLKIVDEHAPESDALALTVEWFKRFLPPH